MDDDQDLGLDDLIVSTATTRVNVCKIGYDSVRDSLPEVFASLVALTDGVVTSYRSDLYHDALWLDRHVGCDSTPHHSSDYGYFFFGFRDTGTSVGLDPKLVGQMNDHLFHCELRIDRGRTEFAITPIKLVD